MTKSKIDPETLSAAYAMAPKIAEEIQPLYAILGWTWGNATHPPTKEDITKKIFRMISTAALDGCPFISTGGLTVSMDDGVLEIQFSREYVVVTGEEP